MRNYLKLKKILDSLSPYSINLGLERINALLKILGNPQETFKTILIGGTNGKGSVSQFLHDSLYDKGYSVGLYTSPHLILLNERIKINNKPVSFDELLNLAIEIEPIAKSLQVTYFEFLTALAFLIFKEYGVKYAVVEVGMGGEFDATNTVNPILSIITSISLDHTEHLGNTIEKITKTKIAIIKKIGVIGKNKPNVIELIKKFVKYPVYFVDENYLSLAEDFDLKYLKCNYEKENLACAMLAIDILNSQYGLKLSSKALHNTYWPGRFEIIKTKDKTIIIDGAHNIDGAKRFLECVKKINGTKLLIYSSLRQKDYINIFSLFAPEFDQICITKINNKNSISSSEARKLSKEALFFESANEAIIYALNTKYENLFFAGSLYLAAIAKAINLTDNLP